MAALGVQGVHGDDGAGQIGVVHLVQQWRELGYLVVLAPIRRTAAVTASW